MLTTCVGFAVTETRCESVLVVLVVVRGVNISEEYLPSAAGIAGGGCPSSVGALAWERVGKGGGMGLNVVTWLRSCCATV